MLGDRRPADVEVRGHLASCPLAPPEQAEDLLAPGFGAQGGTVADIRRIFGSAVAAVTPSSSRELLRKGPSVEAMRDEALRLNDELRALAP